MRYLAPINEAGEAEALRKAGADELYCGVLESWWTERYGTHDSVSRRQGRANLASREELRAVVEASQAAGMPLWLALNTRYTEPQLDYLVDLCAAYEQMGGHGVILSDLGLLWRLQGSTKLEIVLSILAVAQNVPTLRAFQQLGVSRVVLPRFVTPDAARELLHAVPGMQAEVMAFFDKCPLVDGYCRHTHLVSYPDRPDGVVGDAPPLGTFDTTYRTHACLGRACNYLDPYPCGACELASFARAGVQTFKLGGRGRLLSERVQALRFLRQTEACDDDAARVQLYEQTYQRPCSCYYGQRRQSASAIEPIDQPDNQLRHYVGSQTDVATFVAVLRGWKEHARPDGVGLTVLIPPLSEDQLAQTLHRMASLCHHLPAGTHLCVNDVGTLVSLAQLVESEGVPLILTMGTLLARAEDPSQVAHYLSAQDNPARPIYGPMGEPRTLVYAPPGRQLRTHWAHPSGCEPSAQQALYHLTGTKIAYEFA